MDKRKMLETLEQRVDYAVWRLCAFMRVDAVSIPGTDGKVILYGPPERCRQLLDLHEGKE